MATVNKPILLDETGKDIASAVREQTQALQTAIQSISIGGGSGGGDDGYFPANQIALDMLANPISKDGYLFWKIYDPATAETPPLKHIVLGGYQTATVLEGAGFLATVWKATDEEIGNGEPVGYVVMNVITIDLDVMFFGTTPVPKADTKPLWVGTLETNHIMPMYGFY